MSFGAISKETKIALAQGSAMAKTAMCSGEGGILPEEINASYRYIFESDISLVITGGLRVSSDFAKAIAMGADAIAIASAGLIATACQQYRICGTGKCPVGVATQDPELRERFQIDAASKRVANFLNCSLEELKTFSRITGHTNLHDLTVDDLCTVNREISEFTNIKHA